MTMLAAAVVILLLSHTALGHLMAYPPSYDTAGIDKGNYSNTWAVKVEGGKAVTTARRA